MVEVILHQRSLVAAGDCETVDVGMGLASAWPSRRAEQAHWIDKLPHPDLRDPLCFRCHICCVDEALIAATIHEAGAEDKAATLAR